MQGLKKKLWGTTYCLSQGPRVSESKVEVWHASIVKGGYSSRHRHLKKANVFIVISGAINIELEGPMCKMAGDQPLLVPAGMWHRFRAITDVELLEVYVAEEGTVIDPDDIERQDEGGVEDG